MAQNKIIIDEKVLEKAIAYYNKLEMNPTP